MKVTVDTDRFIREVITEDEYSYLFKDIIILDIGCNTGSFSLWMYNLSKKIYGIDIDQRNIDNFNKTIEENKLVKIKTFCCGISGKTGTRSFIRDANPGLGGEKLGKGEDLVRTYTVHDFLRNNKIEHVDLLKIDVEGAEWEIINATDFPSTHISTIVGEYHPQEFELEQFKKKITDLGYRFFDFPNYHFLARK